MNNLNLKSSKQLGLMVGDIIMFFESQPYYDDAGKEHDLSNGVFGIILETRVYEVKVYWVPDFARVWNPTISNDYFRKFDRLWYWEKVGQINEF